MIEGQKLGAEEKKIKSDAYVSLLPPPTRNDAVDALMRFRWKRMNKTASLLLHFFSILHFSTSLILLFQLRLVFNKTPRRAYRVCLNTSLDKFVYLFLFVTIYFKWKKNSIFRFAIISWGPGICAVISQTAKWSKFRQFWNERQFGTTNSTATIHSTIRVRVSFFGISSQFSHY